MKMLTSMLFVTMMLSCSETPTGFGERQLRGDKSEANPNKNYNSEASGVIYGVPYWPGTGRTGVTEVRFETYPSAARRDGLLHGLMTVNWFLSQHGLGTKSFILIGTSNFSASTSIYNRITVKFHGGPTGKTQVEPAIMAGTNVHTVYITHPGYEEVHDAVVHEFAHALGLAHPTSTLNDGAVWNPANANTIEAISNMGTGNGFISDFDLDTIKFPLSGRVE